MIKNKTRYAILGALSVMPGSGYDIKKFCDNSISHFWNENYGHIYPVLAQLQKDELIHQINQEKEGRRKIYEITGKGREEFLNWLTEPVEYQPARSELLLKLFYGNFITKEEMIKMLIQVRDKKKQEIVRYKEIEESYVENEQIQKQEFFPYWLAPLRYGILSSETFVAWCDETIERIKNHSVE